MRYGVLVRTKLDLFHLMQYHINSYLEIQPVYGRWRSVTHALANSGISQESKNQHLTNKAREILYDVYYLGCLFYCTSPNPEQLELFSKRQTVEVTEIVSQTLKLSTKIHQEVITKDYRPYLAKETKWDGDIAELPYSVNPLPTGDLVVATLRLGLIAHFKTGREHGEVQTALSNKPQVVTRSMLVTLTGPYEPQQYVFSDTFN